MLHKKFQTIRQTKRAKHDEMLVRRDCKRASFYTWNAIDWFLKSSNGHCTSSGRRRIAKCLLKWVFECFASKLGRLNDIWVIKIFTNFVVCYEKCHYFKMGGGNFTKKTIEIGNSMLRP